MNIDNPAAPASTPVEAATPAAPAVEPAVPSNAGPAPHLLRAPEPITVTHDATPETPAAAAPVISVAPSVQEEPMGEAPFAEARGSVGSARSRRFGMLAASIAVAACVGSALGAAGTAGVSKLMSRSATATPPTPYIAKVVESSDGVNALRDAVAQMRGNLKQVSDGLGALRTSVEASGKSPAAAQDKKLTETIARLNEGIEKIERAQAEPVARLAKVIETLDRVERRTAQLAAAEATGSVVPQTRPSQAHPQQLGAPPQNLQVPQQARPMPIGPAIVEGWRVRRVTDGVALLEGPDRIIEVEAGEVIRGVGRVDDIKRWDGRWVVVTPRGIIR
jgi:hypothetical protein